MSYGTQPGKGGPGFDFDQEQPRHGGGGADFEDRCYTPFVLLSFLSPVGPDGSVFSGFQRLILEKNLGQTQEGRHDERLGAGDAVSAAGV